MSQAKLKYYFPFIAFLVFCCGACDLESLNEPIIVPNIEKEFNIDLWEHLGANSRSAQLLIETIAQEDCTNYSIAHEFSRNNATLNVSLNEIVAPQDCNEGQGPALATVDLGELTNGFYTLNIDLKNTVFSKGQLVIREKEITVNMNSEEGIRFVRTSILRVPDNFIWGYVAFNNPSDASIATAFEQDLAEMSSEIRMENGYYGPFSINAQEKLIFSDLSFQDNQFQTFYFNSFSSNAVLQEQVDFYRSTYGDAVEIKLFNDKGKEF